MKDENKSSEEIVKEMISRMESGELIKEQVKEKRQKKIIIVIILSLFIATISYDFLKSKPEQSFPFNVVQPKSIVHNDGSIEVLIEQDKQGHCIFIGYINNKRVKFLLDTGATYISVPRQLANNLGLLPGGSYFSQTPNGNVLSYKTIIREVRVGAIMLRNIEGAIVTTMEGDEILLGMSFFQSGIDLMIEKGTVKLSKKL
ncbi:MAG: retropepsin-like aspartic protease [Candidatus Parabeggiatoa sp.]|nr:retropepsin-like aspartic protease [Candidatus Parabeggiatoa sp.]